MPDHGHKFVKPPVPERRGWRPSLHWFSLLPLGLLAAGCPSGGKLDNPDSYIGGGAEGTACDATPIFEEKCAGGLCHSTEDGMPPVGGTDLTSEGVGARVLNAPATYADVSDMENCPDPPELLIDPENPEQSLLLTKLLGTHSCGEAMPVPNPPSALDDDAIECIRSWIQGVIATGGEGGGGAVSGMGGMSSTDSTDDTMSSGMGGETMDEDPVDDPTVLRVEAECAFGSATGDCGGTFDGSTVGELMLEAGDTAVGFFDSGDALVFPGVDFADFDQATLSVAKGNDTGGTIELRRGGTDGTLIASHDPAGTGSWDTYQEVTITFDVQSGQDDLYIVGAGEVTGIANIDYVEFSVQ